MLIVQNVVGTYTLATETENNNITSCSYPKEMRAVCKLVCSFYIIELRISPKSYYVEVAKPVKNRTTNIAE